MQLNKLKLGIKNNTEVTLKSASNIVGDSNDDNNFLHMLLLTNAQVSKLCKAFANNSSANIKLSKTQLHKIGQSGFLRRLLGRLLKTGMLLMGNVVKPLAKRGLIQLGLIAATSATDAAIHKKILESGCRSSDFASRATTLIIFNEEVNDIIKIVTHLKNLVY